MKFHYYGHACFSITTKGKTLLFDPFISGNPKATQVFIDEIACDYILLSHGHTDHILDCQAIAAKTEAKVICSWEIHEWLNKKGVENTHPMNTGGRWDFEDFAVKCVVAQHSSSLPDGTYGGNPMGFIVTCEDCSFYYAGDTALTLDMQLIPSWASIDFAILPIGDNFTMGIKDAARAAEMVETKKVIAVHFDTFGFIEVNHEEAISAFHSKGIDCTLPVIGNSYEL